MSAIFDWCLPQGAKMADAAHRSKILKLCRICRKLASSNASSFKTVKLIQSFKLRAPVSIFKKTLSWSLLCHNSILHSKFM